ncbi:hypothetical protein DFH06DRAFT_1430839 [Mycena polygramma]|nr:hypothetical protein DFH06DRAFT_1430835 [Mycena polygramma]KAJ7640089.1 hypothetical protein DFH06DRAFT_1334992 [Mycena polygramma]KAJ7640090.1 hypothetical protein DFH06DRAFT_1430839 [Mycena polygramma]
MMDTGMEEYGTDVVERFWVPRAWEKDAPRCVTHSVNGVIDFLDQVDDIIALAQIVNHQEMKQILTSYLPAGLRNIWRSMDAYGAGHSYADCRHAIRGLYPEIAAHECGSLSVLDELCEKNNGIGVKEEGRLRRFGLEFCALVAKTPPFITNRDACQKYLTTLDPAFSSRLRQAVVEGKLLRLLARQAGVMFAEKAEPYGRKEDPILLQELVELAEALASMDVEPGRTVNLAEGCRPNCQLESMQERLHDFRDGLHVELQTVLREIDVLRGEVQALRQHTHIAGDEIPERRGDRVPFSIRPTPYPETLAQYANPPLTTSGRHRRADDSQRLECHYCNRRGHFAKTCATRMEHLTNRWISVQAARGNIKLFNGQRIPRGRGSPAWRVAKVYRNANFDMETSNASVERSKGRQVNTLLDEVRGMRQEVAELEKQDVRLLNYWRSEWARRSATSHAGYSAADQRNTDAKDDTAVEDEDVLRIGDGMGCWNHGLTEDGQDFSKREMMSAGCAHP